MDGANIEIREECGWKLSQYCSVREPCFFASHVSGEDTMFIFGCLEHEAVTLKRGLTPLFLWLLLLLLLAYDDVDELSCNVQVAGVAAKAKNGDYPIDSRLQAVFQVGLVPAEAASAFRHVHDLKSSWRQFAMVSSPRVSRRRMPSFARWLTSSATRTVQAPGMVTGTWLSMTFLPSWMLRQKWTQPTRTKPSGASSASRCCPLLHRASCM